MRLAEQHEDHGIGMALADFGDLCGGVTIAGSDFPQVFAGHTIKTVKTFAVVAGGDQQLVERSPVVSPIEVEADALAQFGLINFAAPPLLENVLVAGKDGLDSEHDWAISGEGALLE